MSTILYYVRSNRHGQGVVMAVEPMGEIRPLREASGAADKHRGTGKRYIPISVEYYLP